jgi:tetratricopeptide (TPR) repeat protein
MRMRPLAGVFLMLVLGTEAAAQGGSPRQPQARVASAPSAAGEAYFEFMRARHLQEADDMDGAMAALDRAAALDPASADVQAERASLFAQQNKGVEARAAAQRALALDAGNVEAHRIMALVLSAWSEGAAPLPAGETVERLRSEALTHFEAIKAAPATSTDLNLMVTHGRTLLRAGRLDEAATILQSVTSQAPYAAEPFALLAEAQAQKGQLSDAARSLQSAADINPRYFVSLGDLYERAERWAAAAGAYGRAVEAIRSPTRDLRLRHINALLKAPGGVGADRALEALTPLLASAPDDARLLLLQSTALRLSGDAAGAATVARQVLAQSPTNVAAMSALATALGSQYQFREMTEALAPLVTQPAIVRANRGEAVPALLQLSLAHQQLAQYDEALAAVAAARAVLPSGDAIDMYEVQVLLSARRFDAALAVTERMKTRSPGETQAQLLHAKALTGAGRGAEAVTLLEAAARQHDDDLEVAFGLADAYVAQKQYDSAVKVLARIETAGADAGGLMLRMVSVYEAAGRIDDAERRLRRLIEADPSDASALNYLGYMLADRTTRAAEGVALVERALTLDPDNPSYLDSYGWALFKQGRLAEAIGPLGKAAAALPANSVIQEHHGDALAGQKKWPEAASAYQRALDGDGESIDRTRVTKKLQDARRRR